MSLKIFQIFLMLIVWGGCWVLVSKNVEAAVVINEIYPNPEGDDEKKEWVEIYNEGSSDENVEGWYLVLQDNPGSNQRINLTGLESNLLKAKAFKVYLVDSSSSWLNNGGDSVRLYNGGGEMKDGYTYGDSKDEKIAWGRHPDGGSVWAVMQSETPGVGNNGPAVTATPSPSPTPVVSHTPTPKPTMVPTNTPSPTVKPIASPTLVPTVKKELTPEAGTSGQISPGEEDEDTGEVLGETTEVSVTPNEVVEASSSGESRNINWLAVGLVGGGAMMLVGAGVPMWREWRKNKS